MTDEINFLERLGRGPAALLLGQSHLALGAKHDPLLEVLANKLGSADLELGYGMLTANAELGRDPGLLHWLDERSRTLAPTEQLETIARYQWIGVWSSALDSIWPSCFETSWREVQRVFSESFRPADPRNRRRLHCTYLFGSASRSDPDERPPTSRLEYLQRRAVSQALSRRILEALGPTGTLAIEALRPHDWFNAEDLIGLVAQMQPGQCHLFNAPLSGSGHLPEIAELAELGLVTLHPRSLAITLAEGAKAGSITLDRPAEDGDLNRLVSFGGSIQTVPKDLWLGLSNTALLVDEATLAQPSRLTDESRYQAFRSFLGATETRQRLEGIARGFAYRRDFENLALESIRRTTTQRELPDRPIVVHGATGTGKSTAMLSLAMRLASERNAPVLYLDRMATVRAQEMINKFGKWAEDEGAPATLVFWDGMLGLDAYDGMARFFASRGRRIVLVGSSYGVREASTQRGKGLIHAPSELSGAEVRGLSSFLGTYDASLSDLTRLGSGADATFLVYLYRLLPSTRAAVRTGVVRELEYTERVIADRAASADSPPEQKTSLGWALLKAGLLPELDLNEPSSAATAEEFSAIEDLTALVMVGAQFGLTVPLEVALRAAGRVGYSNLPSLLSDVDLIRWIEDRSGNFHLGARSRLEAQLIVASRLGMPATEVAYARRLIAIPFS